MWMEENRRGKLAQEEAKVLELERTSMLEADQEALSLRTLQQAVLDWTVTMDLVRSSEPRVDQSDKAEKVSEPQESLALSVRTYPMVLLTPALDTMITVIVLYPRRGWELSHVHNFGPLAHFQAHSTGEDGARATRSPRDQHTAVYDPGGQLTSGACSGGSLGVQDPKIGQRSLLFPSLKMLAT
jgi:hypothetical protein